MSVKVRCSSCDKVLTVPDTARGKAVKCPNCDTKIPVPAAEAAAKPAKKKPAAAAKSSARNLDSEDALATLDLRKVEDANARICSKCGNDMSDLDEEETECPNCGFDIEAGGMGAKARKRAMRGPDPADFYPGLAKGAMKFVGKNQLLAWRTDAYILVCLLISLACAFMYLWLSQWPPRVFFGLCFTVSFLVIPGWLWLLDTEVIKLTLERKDKFKRLNFDFFLASSKGVIALAWAVVGAGPILLIPGLVGYYLVNYSGSPPWVMGVCLGAGLIPVLWMLPITMSHMTMPISTPGWMFWKVTQFWSRSVAACTVWLMWLFVSSIPLIAGVAIIGAVWGNDISNIVQTMEKNADITRRITAAENAPKGGKNAKVIDISAIGKPVDVDLKPLIGPVIVLVAMCLPIGFIGMFNMRTNGQYTYYFKDRLELIDKLKEYKYVSKGRKSEDDDDAPRTLQQDATEGIVFVLVFLLLGVVGGMLYGSLSSVGVPIGILEGARIGLTIAALIVGISIIGAAFRESVVWGILVLIPCVNGVSVIVFFVKHWENNRKLFFQWITLVVAQIFLVIAILAMGVSMLMMGGAQPQQQVAPQQAAPMDPMQPMAPMQPMGGAPAGNP